MCKGFNLPCGGTAVFENPNCFEDGYRCMDCFAVPGSIGQPTFCKEEAEKYEAFKALGGKGWDYSVVELDDCF